MTDNNHPITPPPELFAEWLAKAKRLHPNESLGFISGQIAQLAYRAGADRELQLCLDWFQEFYKHESWVNKDLQTFMIARRPKPPSLKEQALEALKHAEEGWRPIPADCDTIRRALESLPD
jgi:hypothetical protein